MKNQFQKYKKFLLLGSLMFSFFFPFLSLAQVPNPIPTIFASPTTNPQTPYNSTILVNLSYSSNPDYDDIVYTTDGSTFPACFYSDSQGVDHPPIGQVFNINNPISISTTTTIKARICSNNDVTPDTIVQNFTYTINTAPLSNNSGLPDSQNVVITASPITGTNYSAPISVTLSQANNVNFLIVYTTDNTTPFCEYVDSLGNTHSHIGTVYTGTIPVSQTTTIQARACSPDHNLSAGVFVFSYVIVSGNTNNPGGNNNTPPTNTNNPSNNNNSNVQSGNLVPCGTIRYPEGTFHQINGQNIDMSGRVSNPCTFNDVLHLINNIVHFILFFLAVPIAALMFAYAGFLLLTSGGEASKKTKAKNIFVNVVIGLVFAVASWLIIHTVLSLLGYDGSWIGF